MQPWLWRNFHLAWTELGIQIPSKLLGYQYNKDKCLPVKSIAFCSLHLSAKVLSFNLEDFISKYGRMRNISRMMVCFPLTSQDKCLPAREIFSSGRLPYKNRQEQNVNKCNKWLCIPVHTLLCHQASNQRDQHLNLLFLSAHRSHDVLPQLQPPKVREGYDTTHLSSMLSKR